MPRRPPTVATLAALVFLTLLAPAASASVTASSHVATVAVGATGTSGTSATSGSASPAAAFAPSATFATSVLGSPAATVLTTGVVVSPDPAHDLYTGAGGLVIPARHWNGAPGDRSRVASCTDCQWRVSRLCTKADLSAGKCKILHVGCPVDTIPVRIWLSHGDGVWEVVGETCQGPRPPQTIDQVGAQVHDLALAALPALRAAAQPADGALVGLPAVFRTGQPESGIIGADLSVIGLDVSLDSRVRWHWVYGDGASVWTVKAGGAWPDTSVSHVYRRAGTAHASVEAVWRAQYVVEGLGPFAVPGPLLSQSQQLTVVVRAAHAHLVK